jgi:hypothetical protein
MDVSETYIKMCQKATEIQVGLWNGGDFTWLPGDDMVRIVVKPSTAVHEQDAVVWLETICDLNDLDAVWLPRQDQLQGLVDGDVYNQTYDIFDFASGAYFDDQFDGNEPGKVFPSWEQMWLRFVMREKFSKTWNGEDWVAD